LRLSFFKAKAARYCPSHIDQHSEVLGFFGRISLPERKGFVYFCRYKAMAGTGPGELLIIGCEVHFFK